MERCEEPADTASGTHPGKRKTLDHQGDQLSTAGTSEKCSPRHVEDGPLETSDSELRHVPAHVQRRTNRAANAVPPPPPPPPRKAFQHPCGTAPRGRKGNNPGDDSGSDSDGDSRKPNRPNDDPGASSRKKVQRPEPEAPHATTARQDGSLLEQEETERLHLLRKLKNLGDRTEQSLQFRDQCAQRDRGAMQTVGKLPAFQCQDWITRDHLGRLESFKLQNRRLREYLDDCLYGSIAEKLTNNDDADSGNEEKSHLRRMARDVQLEVTSRCRTFLHPDMSPDIDRGRQVSQQAVHLRLLAIVDNIQIEVLDYNRLRPLDDGRSTETMVRELMKGKCAPSLDQVETSWSVARLRLVEEYMSILAGDLALGNDQDIRDNRSEPYSLEA